MNAPEASIIIPCFNRWDLTSTCLAGIAATTEWTAGDVEVILVDNGSDDSTQYAHTDIVIRNFANRGFAVGSNQGAYLASANYLIFLNNDTLPHPGWLQSLLKPLRDDPSIGVVGNRLLWPTGDLQHAGIDLSYPDGVLTATNVEQERGSGYAIAVTGACMAMRGSTFYDLEGFDPAYRNGYEDVDVCLRAWKAGWHVWYAHDSVVTHVASASGAARWAHVQENIDRLNTRWGGATDEIVELVRVLEEKRTHTSEGLS